jgi:hypothetical protein
MNFQIYDKIPWMQGRPIVSVLQGCVSFNIYGKNAKSKNENI